VESNLHGGCSSENYEAKSSMLADNKMEMLDCVSKELQLFTTCRRVKAETEMRPVVLL